MNSSELKFLIKVLQSDRTSDEDKALANRLLNYPYHGLSQDEVARLVALRLLGPDQL
jgi:hypothetical protein